MIDEGYHPMTMYFPLTCMARCKLVEPTESESRASLDLFIMALRDLAMRAKRGETDRLAGAPFHAPRRRLDETRAARNPILRWVPPAGAAGGGVIEKARATGPFFTSRRKSPSRERWAGLRAPRGACPPSPCQLPSASCRLCQVQPQVRVVEIVIRPLEADEPHAR